MTNTPESPATGALPSEITERIDALLTAAYWYERVRYDAGEREERRLDLKAARAALDDVIGRYIRLNLNEYIRLNLNDKVVEHIARTYNMRYEELSDDPYEDCEGGMSIAEKRQRSCIAVRKVMRHYFQTGELRHWKDAEAAAARSTPRSPGPMSGTETLCPRCPHTAHDGRVCGAPLYWPSNIPWHERVNPPPCKCEGVSAAPLVPGEAAPTWERSLDVVRRGAMTGNDLGLARGYIEILEARLRALASSSAALREALQHIADEIKGQREHSKHSYWQSQATHVYWAQVESVARAALSSSGASPERAS